MRSFRAAAPGRPSRVVLHIGAPVTGTDFLRDVMARNRRRLMRSGVLYPSSHLGGDSLHRDAALDVLDLARPGGHRTPGAWDRLAQTARDWRRGTVVVSHELLADADPEQVDRVVGSFGSAEVHVVYVARDLGRQLPLAWQAWVRNGGTASFETYVDRVARRDGHRLSRVFWRSHDLEDVLDRWASVVPPERVHVVTVPGGPDQDRLLWARFATVLGVGADRHRLGADGSRRLDALAATETLRLLHLAGTLGLPTDALRAVEGPPPQLPADRLGWVEDEAARAIDAVGRGGYVVAGDATDLRPDPGAFGPPGGPLSPSAEDVVRAQTAVLASLVGR